MLRVTPSAASVTRHASFARRLHVIAVRSTPHKLQLTQTPRLRGTICHYTSVKERMGDPEDNPSAGVPHSNPDQQHKADEERRHHDAEAQEKAMHMLRDLEAAAVEANPEAGHPENRRMLSTVDYPPLEPPNPTSGWHLQGSSRHTETPASSPEVQGAESRSSSDQDRHESYASNASSKAGDSIYDDNSMFVAWFEDP